MNYSILIFSYLLSTILFITTSVNASSVDNSTVDVMVMDSPLNDSIEYLNKLTNQRIINAVKYTNSRSRGTCNRVVLYNSIKKNLGGGLNGAIQLMAEEDPKIDKMCLDVSQTFYKDSKYLSLVGLACVVNLDNLYIGSDKFGHFFDQGHEAFEIAYLEHKGIKKALDLGDFQERYHYGALVSGAYSYADLMANFQGMRFYVNLFSETIDPLLRKKVDPYFQCNNGFFKMQRPFEWEEYIDEAWSESYNCSKFSTESQFINAFKQEKRLMKLYPELRSDDSKFRCAKQPNDKITKRLTKKYGPISHLLLNFDWRMME